MRYEVTSRHRKGFLEQKLVVVADNPDDACGVTYDTWDMEERVITKIKLIDATLRSAVRDWFICTCVLWAGILAVAGLFVLVRG